MENFSIPIPHLQKGQSVRDWRVLYASATSVLTDEQQRKLLPIAVDRNTADQAWATKASSKANLKVALDELETRLDGKPTRQVAVQRFFDLKPATAVTLETLSVFFFEVLRAGKTAVISYDLIAIKFLQFIPGATKLFSDNEKDIKSDMTEDKVIALFDKVKERVQKRTKKDTEIKEEVFMTMEKEEAVPGWAQELQAEVATIRKSLKVKTRCAMTSTDSCLSSNEEAFYTKKQAEQNKKKGSWKEKVCPICEKRNHTEKTCYQRVCNNCQGKGHDAKDCPTKRGKKGPRSSQ